MELIPWSPLRDLERMRSTIDHFFRDPNWGLLSEPWRMRFPVEVVERADHIAVRAELAGIDPKDVDVRITDESITLRGERKREADEEHDGIRHSERFYGAFARTIAFPVPVDSTQAKATFRNGLLEVTAPKRQPNDGRDGRRLDIEVD